MDIVLELLNQVALLIKKGNGALVPVFGQALPAQLLLALKITSGVVSLLAFVAIVYLSFRISKLMGASPLERLGEAMRTAPVEPTRLAKHWSRIKNRLEKGSEAEWKLAVIEADKLCDTILRRMGHLGETMGERLGNIKPAQLSSLEQLQAAHKTRNTIVHDPQFYLSEYEAKQAILNYETFLKEMQIIQE
ncbi:MAG: hypothetical protein A2806_03550 [Candidatus Terrybacteria bacterium RIFCSPHIGHO2_01_FULL_48_17]|uniref:DUF4145 domain-containing protein n=1 Tax=Candidatus Terrybacteria bacterium RIFCSPHIGHO2_01_FULL_48_17 TaxID=1802362 RepID=A0A1G2PH57_9BACT|nr:MAG: hypothetical protein A2806_03550 [Candidatus Terrybacteria bacterium RIFCSPHIGHO2_01_FULL_48_17]OHA53102.1 MAG: hypothetical protein A3A30_01910 [Candidatus Terrybacteria bacterium RIFCSPLOWO2_01_FULL_48_14]